MFLPYPCILPYTRCLIDKPVAADIAAALVFSRLDYANSFCMSFRRGTGHAVHSKFSCKDCITAAITPRGTHFSNFIGCLSNGGYSLSWLPLPTTSYTPVIHHICLNASIPTFFLAPCDHHPPLTCNSLALTSISVHARFICSFNSLEFSLFYS